MYVGESLRILEAAFGICAVMLMGTGSLWIGMIIMTAGLELSCRYIEKKRKKLVHLPKTDAPDILPIQTK